jgi:hypothetical protein
LVVVLAMLGTVAVAVLLLAAVPATADLLGAIRRRHPPPVASPALAVVTVAAIGFGVVCTVPPIVGIGTFDRYLLPLVPLVGVLVLRAGSKTEAVRPAGSVMVAVSFALLTAFGLVYTANSASFDGAKWRVASRVAETVGADRVEGGFEWTDYHAGREVFFGTERQTGPGYCFSLGSVSDPGTTPSRLRASVWGPTGTQMWIVATPVKDC